MAALVLGAACDLSSLFGVSAPRPVRGGTVTEAVVGEMGSLNPLFVSNDNDRDLTSLEYLGLVGPGTGQQTVPVLSSGWSLSQDGLTYTFTIRAGQRWSDGKPFTADDVAYTFSVLQDSTYTEPAGAAWRNVQVQEIDSAHVQFTLRSPSASFPTAMMQPILPAHVFQGTAISQLVSDPRTRRNVVGTGPFVVESVTNGGAEVVLSRNPVYSPQPYLDHVVFHSYPGASDAVAALLAGEADDLGGLQPQDLIALGQRSDLSIKEMETFQVTFAVFNLQKGDAVMTDVAVRQAMTAAINRQDIVSSALAGHADQVAGPLPPSSWAYWKAPAATQRSAAMLDADGWVLPKGSTIRQKNGALLAVDLQVANSSPYLDVGKILSRQLARVGVAIQVDPVPAATLLSQSLTGRNYDVLLVTIDTGRDPDLYSMWHSGAPAGSVNFAPVPHQGLIDQDLEQGRAQQDPKLRLQTYVDFQKLVVSGASAIFLYEPHYLYAMSGRVHGFTSSVAIEPQDRFLGIAGWYTLTSSNTSQSASGPRA